MGFWSGIPVLGNVVDGIFGVIDEVVEDKDKANTLKASIQSKVLDVRREELTVAGNVITAEAKGESWLQRNWRPVTMLTFVGLVVAHWLGFTAPNLPNEQALVLLDIIKVGLGGYVLGRSGEKMVKAWKEK